MRYLVYERDKHDITAPWVLFAECFKKSDAEFIARTCEMHSDRIYRVTSTEEAPIPKEGSDGRSNRTGHAQ